MVKLCVVRCLQKDSHDGQLPRREKYPVLTRLTANDANALLRTIAEIQAQVDEKDEGLPICLISGLQLLRKKLDVIPVHCPCSESKCLTHNS